ncbi:MAG TPA: MFS transporter [Acidimicrobiales bacterium]|jgi:MFS family permease
MQRSGGLYEWRHRADRAARVTGRRLQQALGGEARSRVIVLLACVLALSSADASTVGASATQLRAALHIGNTDIGLLVTVSSIVAAVASVPFGIVADRWRRTRTLGVAIVVWGIAMLWSATASSFGRLLLARVLLGVVTAAAGPIVASLIGDYFAAAERGRVYSYILTGELVGAGIGFAVTGDIAALSWRASFVLLAIPAFVLAWYVLHLPEPARGGHDPLIAVTGDIPQGPTVTPTDTAPAGPGPTDAQRLAAARGIQPDASQVLGPELGRLGLIDAARAVLRIRTNVILIVASACGYFYLSGIETFATEYVKEQYHIDQALANLLLLVVGVGAVVGVLLAGGLSDRLLQRGFLNSRILVAAIAALLSSLLFLPAIFTRSAVTAVPYLTLAAVMLSAQNPPIDAARLDIVPPLLWGRAEGIRTALRTSAQSLAPVTFGVLSERVFGGGRSGLQWTFAVLLIVMTASGVILLRALRTYPRDVATAAAAESAPQPAAAPYPASAAPAADPPGSPAPSGWPAAVPLPDPPPAWPEPPPPV